MEKSDYAKQLYQLCVIYEDVQKNGFHIYKVEDDRFRIDCGDKGSCEVSEHEGEEHFNLKEDDWLWVEGKWWYYMSMSEHNDEYPELLIGTVIKLISDE